MHTKMNTRLLRLALAGAAALAAIAPASASAASGGLLGGTLKAVTGAVSQATTACDANAVTAKTFAPWLDQANYKAAPGGDFESGSPSWTLTGGAKIVAGNASQQVGGAERHLVAPAPAGRQRDEPRLVRRPRRADRPHVREGPASRASCWSRRSRQRHRVPAGVATGGPWSPTLPMLTGLGLLGKQFSIRVTNIGVSTMRVDDVYIDPYRRG